MGCDLNYEKVKNSDLPVLKSEETITLSISGEFDFGSVDVGDSSTQQITLTADDDFEVTNITLPSLDPPFRIDSDSTDCGDSLPKGGSCTITVTFQPFMPENYELNFALRYLNNTHYVNRVYPMTASGISSSTISIEESWNAGLFPIGLKDDGKLFRIVLTGYSPAENFEISGIESPFEYVAGNYPGTNGNCSSSISYSCFIDFTINSDDLIFAKNNLNLSYSISGLPTSTSTVLYGSRAIFLGAETPERIPSLAYGYSKLTSIFSPDGNKLFLIDQNSHRLLIYNSIPSQQSLPDIVIGQESDSVILPNKGKTANKSSLKLPQSIFSDGESMVVTDKGNNRILFWEKIPEVNSTPADLEFTGINAPKSAVIFAGKLIAADSVNDRLLFWDIATYNEGDSGTDMGLSSIESPVHISVEGSSLWVVNQGSENSIKKFSDPFNNPNPETTKSFTATPFHMHIGESKIYVTFTNDHIIKVFDSTLNFLVDIGVDSSGSTTQNTLKFPAASIEINQKVYVTDADNHRLMIWNNPPTTSNETADLQVGQKDFVSSTPHYVAASTNVFRMPFASFYNNNLIISDSGNSRLLKYADNLTSSNIEPSSTSDGFQFGPSTSDNDGTSDYTYVAEWNSATIHYQAIASDQFTPGTTFNAGSNILSVCSNSSFYMYYSIMIILKAMHMANLLHSKAPLIIQH